MKKLISVFIIALSVLFIFTGCNNQSVSSNADAETQKSIEVLTTEEETTLPERVPMQATDLAAFVQERTVTISVTLSNGTSTGSGFFIDDKGTLVTCFHVIDGAKAIKVEASDGNIYPVEKILGFDWVYDVAVMTIDIDENPYLEKNKGELKTGENAYAVGSSLGFLHGSFSNGVISTASRNFNGVDCIQTTAAISSGNSGGPLVNEYGEIIGINAFSFVNGDSLNFAVNFDCIEDLDKTRDMTVKEFSSWYKNEVKSSYYFYDYDAKVFESSLVNSYQTITGNDCLYSAWDWELEDYVEGYNTEMGVFIYDYSKNSFKKYTDYLTSLGFEKTQEKSLESGKKYIYKNEFLGLAFEIYVSTESELIIIEPYT